MPRALVTGATGLVGSYIAEHLLAKGWSVRALVRSPSPELSANGVEVVTGDVLDGDAFARAAATCDVIFHAAAIIATAGGWETYRRNNVDGTQNAIAATERSGARLLHVSSVAVYGQRYHSEKTHEGFDLGSIDEHNFYARSKRESENLVLGAHAAGRIWATAVRPLVIYGRRDRLLVPRVAQTLRFGVAPLVGGGHTTMHVVHAANVASGAFLAATNDVAGGRAYNLANDFDISVRDFFTLAARALGRRVRFVSIPLPVARASFPVIRAVLRLVSGGTASVVTKDSLNMLSRDNPYDSGRARRELGWEPHVHPDEGIADAFRWWREHTAQK